MPLCLPPFRDRSQSTKPYSHCSNHEFVVSSVRLGQRCGAVRSRCRCRLTVTLRILPFALIVFVATVFPCPSHVCSPSALTWPTPAIVPRAGYNVGAAKRCVQERATGLWQHLRLEAPKTTIIAASACIPRSSVLIIYFPPHLENCVAQQRMLESAAAGPSASFIPQPVLEVLSVGSQNSLRFLQYFSETPRARQHCPARNLSPVALGPHILFSGV